MCRFWLVWEKMHNCHCVVWEERRWSRSHITATHLNFSTLEVSLSGTGATFSWSQILYGEIVVSFGPFCRLHQQHKYLFIGLCCRVGAGRRTGWSVWLFYVRSIKTLQSSKQHFFAIFFAQSVTIPHTLIFHLMSICHVFIVFSSRTIYSLKNHWSSWFIGYDI